ncbi:hypothetical protein ASPSYDRAFT_1109975 [Aspergillus sydowii CBS 593.65]|uniref:Uncharacterized protein n=1 Tax=Aspergillus sydowii CBS 593.65 TaxID=1036612 RepID=A0A1L9TC52_9EURO|nr:uncharacterized protein ASPSYDRAFT_1109975 [Aspergillus sydowii CBS 593.65]OJJ57014.1 hypothetical protein ASPSYDRAFT_1109975 [Aspergillus sydowii CBS 593.65]
MSFTSTCKICRDLPKVLLIIRTSRVGLFCHSRTTVGPLLSQTHVFGQMASRFGSNPTVARDGLVHVLLGPSLGGLIAVTPPFTINQRKSQSSC